MAITIEQNTNFKQNIKKNRLKIKELLERKIGEKKSKIGSSLRLGKKAAEIGVAAIMKSLSQGTCVKENGLRTWRDKYLKELEEILQMNDVK